MNFPRVCVSLVALVLLGAWSGSLPVLLADDVVIQRSGTADRVVIVDPQTTMSADEVVAFEATIYDPVNNPVQGEVSWSASNGTITEDGLFYPWSAGLIEIIAEHSGLRGYHNITVVAGVPTSIEITRLDVGVFEPTTMTADLLDARGNRMPGASSMVWDINGEYLGHGQPTWTAESLGVYHARVRYNQLEARESITVSAGAPYEFVCSTTP